MCRLQPRRARIVSGSEDGTIKLWDPASGQELLTLSAGNAAVEKVTGVAFNHDGRQIISATFAGYLKIWDTTPREEMPGRQSMQVGDY